MSADRPEPGPGPESLVSGSVSAFVGAVASAAHAVPAGGSVVALTGASSAALLVLVCRVLRRKDRDAASVAAAQQRAEALQRGLLDLIDADAQAFRAYLADQHSQPAIDQVSQKPLDIARACAEVVDLSREIEEHTQGSMLGDVRAARHLALAARAAALDIADQDVDLQADPAARQRLAADIAALRSAR